MKFVYFYMFKNYCILTIKGLLNTECNIYFCFVFLTHFKYHRQRSIKKRPARLERLPNKFDGWTKPMGCGLA